MNYHGFTVTWRQWFRLIFSKSFIMLDTDYDDRSMALTCKRVGLQIYVIKEERWFPVKFNYLPELPTRPGP